MDFDICEKMLRTSPTVHQHRFVTPRIVICVPSKSRRRTSAASAGGRRVRRGANPATSSKSRWPPRSAPACLCKSRRHDRRHPAAARPRSRSSRSASSASHSAARRGATARRGDHRLHQEEVLARAGERTAEEVKMVLGWLGRCVRRCRPRSAAVIVTGLPKTIVTSTEEIREAVNEPVTAIVDAVKATLDKTPPELVVVLHGARHRDHRRRGAPQRPRRG